MFAFSILCVIGTSIWVLIDASSIGVKKGMLKGFFDMSPVGWFFGCLLIWIIAFPSYLAKRPQLKEIAQQMKNNVFIERKETTTVVNIGQNNLQDGVFFCINCGNKLRNGAKFCPKCGSKASQ